MRQFHEKEMIRRVLYLALTGLALSNTTAQEGDRPMQEAPLSAWNENTAWAFEPGDGVAGGALDLRSMNEDIAGEHGFIRLSESGRILVQCGTIARPTGWSAERTEDPERVKITSTGDMPWRMLHLDASLTIRNPHITKATQLDVMGFPAGTVELEHDGKAVTLTLPRDTLFLIME